MHRPDDLVRIWYAFDQLAHGLRVLKGNGVTDGIRHVDGLGTGLDHCLEDTAQEIDFRATGILGRKLDIVGVLPRPADSLDCLFDHLVRRHAQLFLHVDRRGGDEGMNTPRFGRLDGLAGTADIVLVGAGQRADRGILDRLGNGMDRIEITGRSGSKTGLDHIDAHLFQLAGDANLLFLGHRCARALFAVAQRRIENYQMLFHEELRELLGLAFQQADCRLDIAR